MRQIVLYFIIISYSLHGQHSGKNSFAFVALLNDYVTTIYPNNNLEEYIYIGIKRQKMYHIKKNKLISIYPVSTSAKGAGNKMGTFKTPTGLHTIVEKIGQDVPLGTLFVKKKNVGNVVNINKSDTTLANDEITSRILSLKGEELGINKGSKIDSYVRGIYIHGTSDEATIGRPASHGCIRMINQDVIKLFDNVQIGTKVLIINN